MTDGMRILLLGTTGTIGRATAIELLARGHRLICPVRAIDENLRRHVEASSPGAAERIVWKPVRAADPVSFIRAATDGEHFDAVVSCLASRSGVPDEAWAVDHAANLAALAAAEEASARYFVLLSAICVQKPLLAFQLAKLAFEAELRKSSLTWSIVRPTAFFKSLSGQVDRVRSGRPFLIFGDGQLTACKPISDRDVASFMASCLVRSDRQNAILPIGGPGPALTPLEQGRLLFEALGIRPKFRSVPVAMLDVIGGALSLAGHVFPWAATKAELARIGRYYATESMLVLDSRTGRYDADATPSFGRDDLAGHYARLAKGGDSMDLGAHAVFSRPKVRKAAP